MFDVPEVVRMRVERSDVAASDEVWESFKISDPDSTEVAVRYPFHSRALKA